MSLHEVEEVARLAAQGGIRPQGGGPTVHKVADALGLAPSDVETMLDQARQGSSPIRDFKIVLAIATLAFAFLLGAGFSNLLGRRSASPVAVSAAPTSSSSTLASSPSTVATSGSALPMARPVPAQVATTVDNPSSQLYANLAPLDAKTLEGDLRNTKRRGRMVVAVPSNGDAANEPMVLHP